MKVSVAMATFNGAAFLREQLDSILCQTRLPDELVVGDDASSDETVAIINDFSGTAPFPVRIHVNEHKLGVIENFDRTISRCSGEIIFLSDQDDVWVPSKIEQTVGAFKHEMIVMVFSEAETVSRDLMPLTSKLSSRTFTQRAKLALRPYIFELLLERNIVTGMTMAFRSKVWKIASPIPRDIPETIHDGWIALVASLMGECFFIPSALAKYRQHAAQMIGASSEYQATELRLSATRVEQMKFYTDDAFYNLTRLEKLRRSLDAQIFPNLNPDAVKKAVELWEKEREYWSDRADHFRNRSELPRNRLMRLGSVVREAATGRYSTFSRGWRSFLKDLYAE